MTTKAVCLTPLRVTPGARLARPVLRTDGNMLLAAGSELDSDQLANLWERGIEFVYIEVADTRDDETRAHDLAAVGARVKQLFRGPSNAARDELQAVVLAYRREGVE